MIDPITNYILENDESYISETLAAKKAAISFWSWVVGTGVKKAYNKYKYWRMNPAQKGLYHTKEFAKEWSKPTIGILTLSAVLALMITASYQTYKRTVSKAARDCRKSKRLENESQNRCLKRKKIEALEIQISILKTEGMKTCSQTKDPNKCKTRLKDKIEELENKLKGKKHKFQKTYEGN